MSNGAVSRDDFRAITDVNLKLNILLDTIERNHTEQMDKCICREGKCDRRFTKLENRRKIDTGIAATSGFFGGFIAWLTTQKWF